MIKLSKKKNIKTSVIIPCYRCSNTIERAVKSVVDQSYKAYEVILIEDFSNDENKTLNKETSTN